MNAKVPDANRRGRGDSWGQRSPWDPIAYAIGGVGVLLLLLLTDESIVRTLVGSAVWTGVALISVRLAHVRLAHVRLAHSGSGHARAP